MALPSYLSLVNDVLIRLREPAVTTINENVLSKLVSKFVNDAKRQVEDAYNWNALTSTLTAETTDGVFNKLVVPSSTTLTVLTATATHRLICFLFQTKPTQSSLTCTFHRKNW
jgi:hypothetical protein